MPDASTREIYRIERLNAQNLADVEKLHAAVYGRRPAAGFFARKYDTAFTGAQYTGLIAYDGEVPAAFYGVLPCFIDVDGEPLLAAQSADTMTHPDHRHKGLFVRLASATFELCEEHGIRLLFGFPNQNSLPGFLNKLRWQNPVTMDHFVIRCSGPAPIGLARRLPVVRKLVEQYRQNILKGYDADRAILENSVVKDGFHGIKRDEDWFRYKSYSQTRIMKIDDSILWIKAGRDLWIGDIATNPDKFDTMIQGLEKLANKLGMREIYFHACPGTTLHRLFSDRFAPTPSFPVIFKAFEEGLPIDRIKFTSADIDIF